MNYMEPLKKKRRRQVAGKITENPVDYYIGRNHAGDGGNRNSTTFDLAGSWK